MSYGTYTGLTELILVFRSTEVPIGTTEHFTCTKVPVGTTEQIHYTQLPIGTTELILILPIREYPQVLQNLIRYRRNLIKYRSTRRYYRT